MTPLFTQTTIALVWDFDKTLIPGYMQRPLFEHFNVDEKAFWGEVNALPEKYRARGCEQISTEVLYLNHILDYVREGKFKALTNAKLREMGGLLTFYPGLPDFFGDLKAQLSCNEKYASHGLKLEHYVVSTGLTQMIKGSVIADQLDGIWGCELLESPDVEDGVVSQLGYVLDNTTKTRALFEINKGSNKNKKIDVNATMKMEDRAIPFQNMVYIADGPSDVPVFSVMNQSGGQTFGVYNPESRSEFKQINQLQRDGRVKSIGPADYRFGSQTAMWLSNAVEDIADRIVQDREQMLGSKVGQAPRHLND